MALKLQDAVYVCTRCRQSGKVLSRRPFSSSVLRNTAVPDFHPTPFPDFDALLTQYRDTLFIPRSLSTAHQRLIYRPTRQRVLTNDPGVTVSVNEGEDVRLQPQKLSDRPDKHKSLGKLSHILGTTTDETAWSNVVPFLEAMNEANVPVPAMFVERLTRTSFEQGKHRVMLRCIEMARKTRVSLSNQKVAKEFMLGCHRRAVSAKFSGEDFISAARDADHIALLLEKEEHCGGKLKHGHRDMRKSLMVNGVLLEMHAARALDPNFRDTADRTSLAGDVAKVVLLSEDGLREDWVNHRSDRSTLHVENSHLEAILPLWHGLKLLQQVKGLPDNVKSQANERLKSLEKEIKQTEATISSLGQKDSRATDLHKALKAL